MLQTYCFCELRGSRTARGGLSAFALDCSSLPSMPRIARTTGPFTTLRAKPVLARNDTLWGNGLNVELDYSHLALPRFEWSSER